MAEATLTGLSDTWANLRANPLFRRSVVPRGARFLLRSPIPRALGLTMLALAVHELAQRHFLSLLPIIVMSIVFWFTIQAFQRYLCWLELVGMTRSGNLADYLNSGLNRADIAMGVIYPAAVAEDLSIIGVLSWFALTGGNSTTMNVVYVVLIALRIKHMVDPPFVFMPDVESYLRKRNPLALFFLSIAVWVPLMIWFAVVYAVLYGGAALLVFLKIKLSPDMFAVAVLLIAMVVSRFPQQWWNTWRIKRFYKRFGSFDNLFDNYVEQDA